MESRKIIVIFILIGLIIPESYANNHRFILKTTDADSVQFEMNMLPGYSIYGNGVNEDIGFPTKIKIFQTTNLKSYELIWPNQKQKYVNGIGQVYY